MNRVELEVGNWFVEGSADGLLLNFASVQSQAGRSVTGPGFASATVEERLLEQGLDRRPMIPIIHDESWTASDVSSAAPFLKDTQTGWSGFVSAGKQSTRAAKKGTTHYGSNLTSRTNADPSFVMAMASFPDDQQEKLRVHDVLDDMHLTMGRITVADGVVAIESDGDRVLDPTGIF